MFLSKADSETRWLKFFLLLVVGINFSGLFIPILGPDGDLYACIARNMVEKRDFINLFSEGKDWLDKPHFPFWITALSFSIFGFKTWAYKLPGILFLLMGAYDTYRLAKSLYTPKTALWSSLILLTAEQIIQSNNDVRAEGYLTGLIIAAVYHFHRYYREKKQRQLITGCVFAACAVMTKGLFALIPIVSALAGEICCKKQWSELRNRHWLFAGALILLLISPELICLYLQFDLHPEKVIFGHTHVSGIRFFFWGSQFGRFFNSGPIKGEGNPLFFFHTILWAFIPWSLLAYPAVYHSLKKGIRSPATTEWYCLSAAMVTFLVFSFSGFQLPYYLNILYPFFAILTAQYLLTMPKSARRRITANIQTASLVLILLITWLLNHYYQPSRVGGWALTGILLLLAGFILLPLRANFSPTGKIFLRSVLCSLLINFYLNTIFYPDLLHYQAGSVAAAWINGNHPGIPVVQLPGYPS